MATTYKFLAIGEVETLTANVFADQIEIYDGSLLDPCTMYVWFHDDRLGNNDSVTQVQAPARIGAGGNTYDVNLGTVASSGDYWCEIRVGTTEDCWFETERRTISIIECVSPQDRTLAATGASATASVRHPHYETPVFSNEGLSWITLDDLAICDDQADHVCLSVASYSLDDQVASANSARRGQATITTGPLICFFGIAQDYIPAAPDPVVADPAPGPFISLSQNGPSLIGNTITVTADVGTIPADSDRTYTVTWTNAAFSPAADRTATVTSSTATTTAVTATVTDDNGLTAEASINVVHTAPPILQTTTLQPSTVASLSSRSIWSVPPTITTSGVFTVGGGGNWNVRATINPLGFLQGSTGVFSARLTITGPGVNVNEVITTTSLQTEQAVLLLDFEGLTGEYNWEYSWDFDLANLTGRQQPAAFVIISPRLF